MNGTDAWTALEPKPMGSPAGSEPLATTRKAFACGACEARKSCQIAALDGGSLHDVLGEYVTRRFVRAGQTIYRSGSPLTNLYVPRCGICKAVRLERDGHQQITAFKIAGECFGMDGLASGSHQDETVALVDMQVCALPIHRIEARASSTLEILRKMEQLIGTELLMQEALLMRIAHRQADQRVAAFLLDLGERYGQRSGSPDCFPLCISRQDIGAHLGLALETVSRAFARLRHLGLIDWAGRVLSLRDRQRLAELCTAEAPDGPDASGNSQALTRVNADSDGRRDSEAPGLCRRP